MDFLEPRAAQPLTETELDHAFAAAKRYAEKSRAASTWRAYHNDWRQFEAWCASLGLDPLPATPETVAMFVANQADIGRSPSTINRRLAAIRLAVDTMKGRTHVGFLAFRQKIENNRCDPS